MANDMKRLSEEIVSSYKQRAKEFQQRLKDNEKLADDIQKTLKSFRNDQMEMAATLKANAESLHLNLALEEKERMTSFRQMMSGINQSIEQIQDEVKSIKRSTTDLIKDFENSHTEMTAQMHSDLKQDKASRMSWNSNRLADFNKLMRGVNREIATIQKEVADIFVQTDKLLNNFSAEHNSMSEKIRAELKENLTQRVNATRKLLEQFDKQLAEISKENQAMARKLKMELSHNEIQRLKDFKVMFTEIKKTIKEIQKHIQTFLSDSTEDRKHAAEIWARLETLVAQLNTPTPAVKKSSFFPKELMVQEEKNILPNKAELEMQPAPQSAMEADETYPADQHSKKDLTLEEKVLHYIDTHKKGVRVSEMEKPFGETRMRLGFITKKLLDDGKIMKVENSYYPK